jgi:hypothetical protein
MKIMRSPLLLAAPLLVAGYGAIRFFGMADGHYGPGMDWQVAHLAGLLGMVLFVPLVLGIGRLLPRGAWRTGTAAATLIGLAASMVQFGADMVFALRSTTKAEMSVLSHRFSDVPGVDLAIYKVGPQLFFLGLVVLTVLLARARRLPWWSPAVMLVSVLLPVVTLDLIPLAGLGMAAALLPLALRPAAALPRP